jgi:co-chaperonin GroES (HSP10)
MSSFKEFKPPVINDSWTNTAGTELPEGFEDSIPKPTAWRILVMPMAPKRVTEGGIELVEETINATMYSTYVGMVVAMGPLVGTRPPLCNAPFDVGIGEWILYGKYCGQRIEHMGIKLLAINDEDVIATVTAPQLLKVSI